MTSRPDLKELYGNLCLKCGGVGFIHTILHNPIPKADLWMTRSEHWVECQDCKGQGYKS